MSVAMVQNDVLEKYWGVIVALCMGSPRRNALVILRTWRVGMLTKVRF